SVTITDGNGDTSTTIERDSAGTSYVLGSLKITNGTGQDFTSLNDTNFGGSVTVNDGHGGAGIAGRTLVFNNPNTTCSVIGGNVAVTNPDGNGSHWDGIWDTTVQGSVKFNHGSGAFTTNFDGYTTSLPVLIRGSLKLNGTGATTVTAGVEYKTTGLVV